ncbi:MAG: calcineurin-like phosphoesterase C-terminal domain-containing protein [Sedimentisphaerales bacterium]|nr:calcineurin-like phosphoesterase C-terminal domain-containing protein [Sedimentisphaerales bacterium]
MKQLFTVFVIISVLTGCTQTLQESHEISSKDATGIVFNDLNRNGIRDIGEPGIAGVYVSNGRDIVTTDRNGRYQLQVEETIIFVTKPRNWMTPVNEVNLPYFYYIHKPDGSPEGLRYPGILPTGPQPESIDFALYKQPEPKRFDVVIFGDPQASNLKEVNYMAHDAIEEVAGIDAAFGVSLGDVVCDNIEDFDSVNEIVSLIGLPWYNVPGNHDINYYAKGDEHSLETYSRVYGPAYYSFNYGPVHFLVLDSIVTYRDNEERLVYYEGLDSKQLEFIRNDLNLLDKGQLVVLLMHGSEDLFKQDRRKLFEILEQHPYTVSVAGHTHRTEHLFLGKEYGWYGSNPHHLYISGTVSGAWWMGVPDELGIAHSMMTNGVPNGYSVFSFDGNEYTIRFKAFRRPEDYQMNIWAPEEIYANKAADSEIVVNVFAASERSNVQMRIGESSSWIDMERITRKDPYFEQILEYEEKYNIPRVSWATEALDSGHIWRADFPENLPEGACFIHIREIDMFGKVHTGRRLIRIK